MRCRCLQRGGGQILRLVHELQCCYIASCRGEFPEWQTLMFDAKIRSCRKMPTSMFATMLRQCSGPHRERLASMPAAMFAAKLADIPGHCRNNVCNNVAAKFRQSGRGGDWRLQQSCGEVAAKLRQCLKKCKCRPFQSCGKVAAKLRQSLGKHAPTKKTMLR